MATSSSTRRGRQSGADPKPPQAAVVKSEGGERCRKVGTRWGGDGRRTVEQTRVIDIGTLRRAGYVGRPEPNWWKWRNRADALGIWPKSWSDGFIHLANQILCTEEAPWRFGGQRFYFVCDCGRRVERLHAFRDRPWRCRHCHNLSYATRQATPRMRLLMKAQKIRKQLGGSLSMMDDFTLKPEGMHWKRYQRLRRRQEAAEAQFFGMSSARICQLTSRLKSHRP
jgi:hypothetical protein